MHTHINAENKQLTAVVQRHGNNITAEQFLLTVWSIWLRSFKALCCFNLTCYQWCDLSVLRVSICQLTVCCYLQVDSGLVAPEFAQDNTEILFQQNKTELDLKDKSYCQTENMKHFLSHITLGFSWVWIITSVCVVAAICCHAVI